MASTVTPAFTDYSSVVAMAVLNNNGGANFIRRGTLDLRTKFGAHVFLRMGPTAGTAPGAAIDVLVRRVLNNDAAMGRHPGAHVALQGSTAARNVTTINGNVSAGAASLVLTSATGFVYGDICIVMDSVSAPTVLEFMRVGKIASTTLTTDAPIIQALTSGWTICRVADVFSPIWCPGGSLYEVIFDYGNTATGSDYIVQAYAQTYDSDGIV